MNDFELSLGPDTIAYLVDGLKAWFKRDAATETERNWLAALIKVAAVESSTVRCVGMWRPIPINQIYVPTSLKNNGEVRHSRNAVSLNECLRKKENAIIFAGPGYGKTTFLRWAFVTLLDSATFVPLLFTLRRPDAIDDLTHFVELVRTGMTKRLKTESERRRLVLLVDGYDEIPAKQQKQVSEQLLKFEAFNAGNFYLTCRTHYTVYEVKAPEYSLSRFSRDKAKEYICKLATAQSISVDAEEIIEELDSKGFESFWRHPLLLTLIMILKSTASSTIPNSSIGLIKRAIETLSFRWDEEKGISRESTCDIDAPDREECLKYIAYEMDRLIASDDYVVSLAARFLSLAGRHDVQPKKFLIELARFYGLLIPTDDSEWTFTHKTIHDYLAAKFSVEHGIFVPSKVKEWNARAAYAACLLIDATETITTSLRRSPDLTVLTECLSNTRRYDRLAVARACATHFMSFPEQMTVLRNSTHSITIRTNESEWLHEADDALLLELLSVCSRVASAADFALSAYEGLLVMALLELKVRAAQIPGEILRQVPAQYTSPNFKPVIQLMR